MWWGAINRSLVIGFVLTVFVLTLSSCEAFLSFIDSGDTPPEPPLNDAEWWRRFIRLVTYMPIMQLAASAVAFVFHLPFLLLIELFNRLRPT